MAVALYTNAFATYSAVGNREDLTNAIYDVSPTETPVMTAVSRIRATGTKHEWQKDALATAAANAQLEGGDFYGNSDASTATTRLFNYCQISFKLPSVSGTQDAVSKAGRKSEIAYQVQKTAKELKRDMETDITGNVAQVSGGATTARVYGGLQAWIKTNTDIASNATASTGDGSDVHQDGTARAFTEDLLLNAMQAAWTSGAEPTLGLGNAFQLSKVAGFSGGATVMVDALKRKVDGSVKIYVTPWGQELMLKGDRFMPTDIFYALDPNYLALAYLRPFRVEALAKTGDYIAKALLVEYTTEVRNEAGHAAVYDLTTS